MQYKHNVYIQLNITPHSEQDSEHCSIPEVLGLDSSTPHRCRNLLSTETLYVHPKLVCPAAAVPSV